jgi:sialate O-acetylesterase
LKYLKPAKWTDCTEETAADFSAVAYFFGRMLQDSLRVPIGLICNAVGGTNTESWIDRRTLEFEFPNILNDWIRNDFIQDWCRGRGAKNIALALSKGNNLQRHPYQPCYMYEAGIEPLERFPIRGVIWYQGESNAHNKDAHAKLFPLLVDSWRRNWQQPEMPFLFVQLSSLSRPSWPWFRDSQRLLSQQIPHTGMAVTTDVGDSLDVHPRHKQPVGERLARLALADVYRLPYFAKHPSAKQGPILNNVWYEKEQTMLLFDCAEGLTTSDGKAPSTFELADEFGIFHPAQAKVYGTRVHLSSPEVKHPTAVRYGWQPFTRANLVNAYGLPTSTFYTEIK